MLLLKQTGANTVFFCGDNHIREFFNQGITTSTTSANPDVSFAIIFTNDMTRESIGVEFVKKTAANHDLIKYVDGKFTASFLALSTGTPNGRNGEIIFKNRGYYSYVIYMNRSLTVHPTSTGYTSHQGYVQAGGFQPIEVDRGKALVLTTQQYNNIVHGTLYTDFATGEFEYDKLHHAVIDGEVAYTKHTDNITSSGIDADNNFINVN